MDIVAIVAGCLLLAFARPFARNQQAFLRRPSAWAVRFDTVAASLLGVVAIVWGAIDLVT